MNTALAETVIRTARKAGPGIHNHKTRYDVLLFNAARFAFMDSGLAATRRPGMTSFPDHILLSGKVCGLTPRQP